MTSCVVRGRGGAQQNDPDLGLGTHASIEARSLPWHGLDRGMADRRTGFPVIRLPAGFGGRMIGMSAEPVTGGGPAWDGSLATSDDGSMIQLLRPTGELVEHAEIRPDLDPGLLRAFYRDMVLTRRLDIEATALQRQGELGLWAPSLGQEAAQVGSARALRAEDFAFPTYREHGACLVRGITPLEILTLYRGVSNGGWDSRARGMALPMIVIGNQVPHAVGYAMGIQLDRMQGRPALSDPQAPAGPHASSGHAPSAADAAVLAYFGDGASSQGDVNEAFVLAGVMRAPVVFFCQNNQWAISLSVSQQMAAPLVSRAPGFGLTGVRVDGNDVLAVYAVTRDALARGRTGGPPTLIEAVTYRMGPHTTSDDPTRYRDSADVDLWRARDPIARLEAFLVHRGMLDDAARSALDAEAEQLAQTVRHGVREMPDPPAASILDHVYAEGHPRIDELRADAQRRDSPHETGT